jgi:hypothetical protein
MLLLPQIVIVMEQPLEIGRWVILVQYRNAASSFLKTAIIGIPCPMAAHIVTLDTLRTHESSQER